MAEQIAAISSSAWNVVTPNSFSFDKWCKIDDAGVIRVDRDKTADANAIKSDPTKLFQHQKALRMYLRQMNQLRSQQIRFQDVAAAAEAEKSGGVPVAPAPLTARPPSVAAQAPEYRF